MARQFGATDTIDATAGDITAQVKELTGGRGVDHAIEAIGRKDTIEASFAMLAKGGRATVVGVTPPGMKIEISPFALLREVGIQGSNMGGVRTVIDIPNYVDLYVAGKLKLDELVSRTRPLSQINEAVDDMKAAQLARTVITFSI